MVGRSNLACFIETVIPVVPSQKLPVESCSQDPRDPSQSAGRSESSEFFNLRDLWAQYDEWSAYGAGVRFRLPDGGAIDQYYVPYLSGLQIYTNTEAPSSSSSSGAEESTSCNGPSTGLGNLYFEFFERTPPHLRVPLMSKVQELARTFPGLTTYKSIELSPASWMAVACQISNSNRYPIYHIPAQGTMELQAAFLTYHTLSSLFQDESHKSITKDQTSSEAGKSTMTPTPEEKERSFISLAPFGMATYKLHGTFWTMPKSGDAEKLNVLFSSAQSWLQQLNVQHHDFIYFNAHYFRTF